MFWYANYASVTASKLKLKQKLENCVKCNSINKRGKVVKRRKNNDLILKKDKNENQEFDGSPRKIWRMILFWIWKWYWKTELEEKGKMAKEKRDSTAGFQEMLIPSRDGHERQEEKKVVWMTILSHLLMIARTYCLLWDF